MNNQEVANRQRRYRKHFVKLFTRLKKRFYRIPIFRRVVSGAILGILVIAAVARWLPDMKERMKFFADTSLSWVIFVVVAIQAYIYTRQREVMDRTLIVTNRADVGVRSVSEIGETRNLFIHVENVGVVAATDIEIMITMDIRVPDRLVPDDYIKQPPWKHENASYRRTIKLHLDYYNAPLQRGVDMVIPFSVAGDLTFAQWKVIKGGEARTTLRVSIRFHNGFAYEEPEFAFRWRNGAWVIDPVASPEEVWEKLRERTKEFFGDRDPLKGVKVITAYRSPAQPAKTEDKTKREGEKPN